MAEVENGILGVKRDTLMSLIDLMIFRNNSLIRNLIGMSGQSVCWINHFHFTIARTLCQKHLERHIIPSKRERERRKKITIKLRNVMFKVDYNSGNSILINILVKNTILKCTFKMSNAFYVGICTPKQVNNVMGNRCFGWKDCGGSFCFGFFSRVYCCGNRSRPFKDETIIKEEITAVINIKKVNRKGKERKMNIIRDQKRVPHTIINIPKDGVYLGFSSFNDCVSSYFISTLSVISLIHVSVLPLPFNDGMRCITYDFLGRFRNESFNHKDEEGTRVLYLGDYYKW